MAVPAWRLSLQPASYNGVPFKVESDSKSSGRRIVQHEFPKKEIPYAEDMGRRARRFVIAAYIITGPREPDYEATRDDLIASLEAEGPSLLVHPTLGQDMVVVDDYTVTEHRLRGGFAEFQITFFEAGQAIQTSPVNDTQSQVNEAAQSGIQQFQQSDDFVDL